MLLIRRGATLTTMQMLAIFLFWAQRLGVLRSFGWQYIDEDQALLGYTLRELQNGTPHAPTFYGQSYGNWMESAVAALFTPTSVTPWTTLPIATQLLFWIPFAALAFKENRNGRRLLATILLWIPCLLTHRADLLYSMPRAWLPGVSLAMIAATIFRSSPLGLGASLVSGLTLNPAAGLLALPVLIEAAFRNLRDSQWLGRLALGLLLGCTHPLLILVLGHLHPGWSIHPSPGWQWSLVRLWEGVQNPWPLLGSLSGVSAVLLAAALSRSSLPTRAAALGFALSLIGSFGLEKIWDASPSVFFPYERAFVAIPLTATWLFWITAREWRWNHPRLRSFGGLALAILLLSAVLIKEALRSQALAKELTLSSTSVVAPRRVSEITEICELSQKRALDSRAHWVVFSGDRAAAYACAALWNGKIETLHPPYERRQWLKERFRPQDAIWMGERDRE